MFSLRQKQDSSFYVTYDRERRNINSCRGIWVLIGPQDNAYTNHAVKVNESAGLLCANDDEGNVRVLVLTE